MGLVKFTITMLPYATRENHDCPVCQRRGSFIERNIVIFNNDATPFSKHSTKLIYCKHCKLAFHNSDMFWNFYKMLLGKFNIASLEEEYSRKPRILAIPVTNNGELNPKARLPALSSRFFTTRDYYKHSSFWFSQLKTIKQMRASNQADNFRHTPAKHIPKKSNSQRNSTSCQFCECSEQAIPGKLYCRYHHQYENYHSK